MKTIEVMVASIEASQISTKGRAKAQFESTWYVQL